MTEDILSLFSSKSSWEELTQDEKAFLTTSEVQKRLSRYLDRRRMYPNGGSFHRPASERSPSPPETHHDGVSCKPFILDEAYAREVLDTIEQAHIRIDIHPQNGLQGYFVRISHEENGETMRDVESWATSLGEAICCTVLKFWNVLSPKTARILRDEMPVCASDPLEVNDLLALGFFANRPIRSASGASILTYQTIWKGRIEGTDTYSKYALAEHDTETGKCKLLAIRDSFEQLSVEFAIDLPAWYWIGEGKES